jgi:hypothetical protein
MFVAMVVVTMLLAATPVLAGGDKVRGDKGLGDVEQHQVNFDDYASQRLVQNRAGADSESGATQGADAMAE